MVFNIGMSFLVGLFLRHIQSSQGYPLINFNMVSDHGSFPDDDSCSVINEE